MSAVPTIGFESRIRDASPEWATYYNSIRVVTLVLRELFPATETRRADVNAVPRFANRICAFDSNGVGEIAATAVAFDLEARLSYGCCYCCYSVGGNKREQMRITLDFFGWLRLSLPVSDGHWMSPEKEGVAIEIQISVSHLTRVDRPKKTKLRFCPEIKDKKLRIYPQK